MISKISDRPTNAFALEWATTGAYIYYMAPDENEVMHIYRVPQNGGEAERVTNDSNGSAYFPAFTDNGETLLFSGKVDDGTTRILTMPANKVDIPGKLTTRIFVN
jgi:Tol biopolymer transport system component